MSITQPKAKEIDERTEVLRDQRSRMQDATCLTALILVAVLSWIPRFRGPIDFRWDAGVYYVLGTSIASGQGYRLLNEPGQIEAIQYPPGLPALVAAHEIALHSSDPRLVGRWLRRTWFLLSVGSVLFCFLLSRQFLSRGYALLTAVAFVLSYEVFFLSTLCFAELPFAFVTVLFGWVYCRFGRRPVGEVAAGVLAVSAYLLRTLGIALLLGWVADALLGRRYRAALVRAVIAFAPVLAWQSYVRTVESSASYQHPAYSYQRDASLFYNVSYAANVALRDPFEPDLGKAQPGDLVRRFVSNARALPGNIGQVLISPKNFLAIYVARMNHLMAPLTVPPSWVQAALFLFGCGALCGIGLQFRRHRWVIAIYLALTLAAVCITPWPGQATRYLCPLFPFLMTGLFEALEAARASLRGYRYGKVLGNGAVAIGTSVVLLGSAGSFVIVRQQFLDTTTFETSDGKTENYRLMHYAPGFASVSNALEWLKNSVPSESIVAISMPQWAYLRTGLRTVMPPFYRDAERAQRAIDSVPVTYLVVDQMTMESQFNERFWNLVRNFPDKWRLVYSAPMAHVYARTDAGSHPR
jgi:hypothetical protein